MPADDEITFETFDQYREVMNDAELMRLKSYLTNQTLKKAFIKEEIMKFERRKKMIEGDSNAD